MKSIKIMSCILAAGMLFTSCNMSNTGKGALIGGGSGAAVGAGLGAIFGKGKGAAIGAAVGAAVGTTAGALIGKKMDKAAEQAKQVEGAQVEQVTDNNGLQAVKVTFDSGILFSTSSSNLSSSAKSSLSKFANDVLTKIVIWTSLSTDIQIIRAGKTRQQNKVPEKSELISGASSKCSKLSAGMRGFHEPDQICARYGRSQSHSRQLHGSRPTRKSSCRNLFVCKPTNDSTSRSRNPLRNNTIINPLTGIFCQWIYKI